MIWHYLFSLDLASECERLREGFMKSVAASEVKRTLHEVKVMITTPDWQKSANWMVNKLCFLILYMYINISWLKLCYNFLCAIIELENILIGAVVVKWLWFVDFKPLALMVEQSSNHLPFTAMGLNPARDFGFCHVRKLSS
jgi:hypothetical protein